MDNDVSTTRIAVLIDSDNVSAKHIAAILEELASFGAATVRRAYGDWTTGRLAGWKGAVLDHAIRPVQQFSNTVGKNSTDSAMIIDAMDLLWQGNVDAFAIVSGDSDFTRLAARLRESGKRVFGIGPQSTSTSLRRAVDQFISLEVLQKQDQEDSEQAGTTPVPQDDPEANVEDTTPPPFNLQSALTKAVNASSGEDGWALLSVLGSRLRLAHPDFDQREHGHRQLSALVKNEPYLATRGQGAGLQVGMKGTVQKVVAKKATTKKAAPTAK